MKVARYLVTGGAGFIGSNLVEALLRRGEDVRVLDDFSTGRRVNLAAAADWASSGGGRIEIREGDIRDEATCRAAVGGADFVLHQAAIPSVQRSVEDPARTNAVNVSGTLNLLSAAREHGVRRFVFASSSSVYGESEALPKVESMPTAPISPYGLQKLAGEGYCRLFRHLYGLPTVALRYFNVFGPRQDPASEYSAVIPRFVSAIRRDVPPTIYGDGEQTRDFTFVANIVEANLLACRADEAALGTAFNIACGDRISLNGLVRELATISGKSVVPLHEAPRPGDIRHSMACIESASSQLAFRPTVGFAEGLRRTWDSFES
jgi:nucleoside-diphosphate-sugar epimerase